MSALVILVVEDDPVIRLLERKQLSQLGYQPQIVTTGEEALERYGDGISLILMDIGLPGIDGIQATILIRQRETTESRKHVPIIAVTAHSDRERCLAAGMDDFIQKPVLLKELQELLKKWLPVDR